MCIFRLVFLAVCLLTLTAFPIQAADDAPLKILFIGNSYTFFNDLPKMLNDMAKAGGQRLLEIGRELPGGYTFEKHWKDGRAASKIAEKKWDYVVLQENSMYPIKQPKSMAEYGAKLDAAAKRQGAKTIYYLTWARQNTPETQDTLNKSYFDLASECQATVAPVGIAWEMALKGDKSVVLHLEDKSHPNKTGTYLAACVFYGTLYNKSPVGLPGRFGDMSDSEARKLQTIAWKAVQDERTRQASSAIMEFLLLPQPGGNELFRVTPGNPCIVRAVTRVKGKRKPGRPGRLQCVVPNGFLGRDIRSWENL